MDLKQFCSILGSGCDQLEITVSSERMEALYSYFTDLMRWSKKVNLISKNSSAEQVVENHFLDSLTMLKLLDDASHLLDVGTGAGFPGLVCKVAKPGISVSLVEPRLKRVTFLNHVVRTVGLEKVYVSASRVEQFTPQSPLTHITGRAVSEIGLFCQMVHHLAKPSVKIVCMKGPKWEEELDKARQEKEFSFDNCNVTSIVLPGSGAARFLVEFELV